MTDQEKVQTIGEIRLVGWIGDDWKEALKEAAPELGKLSKDVRGVIPDDIDWGDPNEPLRTAIRIGRVKPGGTKLITGKFRRKAFGKLLPGEIVVLLEPDDNPVITHGEEYRDIGTLVHLIVARPVRCRVAQRHVITTLPIDKYVREYADWANK